MPNATQQPTAAELGAALRPKHRQFADLYLTNGLHAQAAAQALGYRNPFEAYRLLDREDVTAYVRARLDESGFTADQIQARLEYFAAGDMRDFVQVDEVPRSYWRAAAHHPKVQKRAKQDGCEIDELPDETLEEMFGADGVAYTSAGARMVWEATATTTLDIDWARAQQANALGRLKKVKSGQFGIEFELHDPVRALELLGKRQGMFTENVNHSGNLDLGVKYIVGVSEDEL
ncbi:terminase small subunit [Deinococcus lacus]|uniref:Terminase small subunit n=1 Tax=Deinococcus lacus TaxID=392561 RepID=A0ABW1YBW7_9DEIO